MSRWTNNNKNRWRRHRRETSQVLALFLALAMVVSLGVDIGSITTTAYANEPTTEYVEGGSESSNDHDGEGEEPEIPEEAVEVEDEEEPDKDIPDDDDDDNEDGEPEDEDTDEDDSDEEESDEVEEPKDDEDTEEPEEGSEEPAEDVIEPEEESLDEDTVTNEDYDKDWIERADHALEDIDDEDLAAALVAVVNSQVGYEEQILDDTDKDVYSLYAHELYNGNNDSRDWNTTFAMWALDKAGFDTDSKGEDSDSTALPVRNDLSAWIKVVKGNDYYVNVANDGISDLEQADIAFLDLDGDEDVDHVGVVTAAKTDDDTLVSLDAVIGDLDADTLAYFVDDVKEDAADAVAKVTFSGEDYGDDAETYLGQIVTGYVDISSYIYGLDTDVEEDGEFIYPRHSEDEIGGYTFTIVKNSLVRRAIAKAASAYDVMTTADTTGIDMGSYITSANFQKKNGIVWETSTEFTTSDQVRGTINFENVYTSTLKSNSNTIYIDLPAGIDCSKFTGTYDTYDGGTHSGKYHYEQNADGSYRIVLVLDDNYVDNAGDTIGGSLQFEFYWDKEAIPDSGNKVINIGNWSGEVKITEDSSGKKEDTSANYTLNKSAGELFYSSDGKTAYVEYTVVLKVNNNMPAPITVQDVLAGKGFTYDKITDNGGLNVYLQNTTTNSDTGATTDIVIRPNSGDTVPAGTYTIKYRVKSTVDISDTTITIPDSVNNTASIKDGDKTISSQTWTKTTTGKINKQGQLVSGKNGTYIDYTVYLNAGDIIKNLKTGANFTDTLPDNLELVGDVTVTQYNVKGEVVSSTTASATQGADGKTNISYTTPTGQYYYIITYRTKVTASEIPIGGITITNDGKSTGGIDGSSSAPVVIPNHVLYKNFESQEISQNESGTWINTMKWTSTIDVSDSLKGYIYQDWAGLQYIDGYWYNVTSMSDAQRSAIVVTDANGNTVDSGNYTVTKGTYTSRVWDKDLQQNIDLDHSLFQIEFTGDVTGPVTISYETTADLSKYAENSQIGFINYASLTKDGHTDTAQAQTTTIQYRHDNKEVIHKYGSSYDSNTSGSITLEPGQTSIPWTIQVNEGRSLTTDLTITDTIPEGLTFIPETFDIRIDSKGSIKDLSGVTWKYDESTRTLTITIKADMYQVSGQTYKSAPIIIAYRTQLPDSFIKGSDVNKEFTNKVTLDSEGSKTDSSYTWDVKRQVVGKSGSYDQSSGILTYNVVINQDGATLNEGKLLQAIDVLTGQDTDSTTFLQYVTLDSLQLFTAVTTRTYSTATSTQDYAKETVKVEAGAYIRDLTRVDSFGSSDEDKQFTYTYDDSTKTFTTYLPDSTAYVIIAKYKVTGDATKDVNLKNTVTLKGSSDWSKEDSSTKVTKDTSGETHTTKDVLTVTKRDASKYSTTLQGATFELEAYKNSAWSKVGDLTTGDKGTATQENIEYKVLYRLGETEAPDGYVVDAGPTYFIVVRRSDSSNVQSLLPDSISGDDRYSKDAVKVFVVEDNTSGKTYYANVEIDRYDQKDTTKVEPGQLRVNKVWVDDKGQTITDAATLAKLSDVTVTLKMQKPAVVTVEFEGTNSSYNKTTMKPGTSFTSGWGGTFELISGNATVSADGKTVTVTGSARLKTSNYANDDFIEALVKDESQASSEAVETEIGTVTLNAANNWTYLWENLDRSDGVTYTVTETKVDGYSISYQLNGADLAAGATITPGTSGDIVKVTNTANPVYELPSTGGSGTLLTYLLGCLAVMVSMFAGYSTWRSGERRVR